MALKSPEEMMGAVVETMAQRTGHSLEEWVEIVGASGVDPLDQSLVRRWLKSEHGIAQNTQWAIADAVAREAGWVRPSVDAYIDSQYEGAKAQLRPVFDRLRQIIESLGDDITVEGRGGYTPFVRRRQFVAIAAAAKTRVDVGLRYVEAPKSPLIVPAKAPGQATHKLSLSSVDDITDEVARLLRAAYEQNG